MPTEEAEVHPARMVKYEVSTIGKRHWLKQMAIPSKTRIASRRTRSAAGPVRPSPLSTTGADGGDRLQASASPKNHLKVSDYIKSHRDSNDLLLWNIFYNTSLFHYKVFKISL